MYLCRFDDRISSFAEQKFRRDGIEVLTGCRVLSVTDKLINMKVKATGEGSSINHGMVVWSTGVGTRPVVMDFMEKIGQVCYNNVSFTWINYISFSRYFLLVA